MDNNGIRLPWRLQDFLSGASFAVSLAVISTGLIVFAIRQEGRINLIEHEMEINDRRSSIYEKQLDLIDRGGTREMAIVKDTQQRVLRMVDHLDEQENIIERKVEDIEGRVAAEVKNNFSLMRADIKRLDEQQSRLIQALDNTYNILQEALRSDKITRQPSPEQFHQDEQRPISPSIKIPP